MSISFSSLGTALRRTRPANGAADEVVPPSEAAQLAAALSAWASHDICKSVFIPYLERLVERADAAEGESLASHVAMAYARGQRDALRALRAEFTNWRGQA